MVFAQREQMMEASAEEQTEEDQEEGEEGEDGVPQARDADGDELHEDEEKAEAADPGAFISVSTPPDDQTKDSSATSSQEDHATTEEPHAATEQAEALEEPVSAESEPEESDDDSDLEQLNNRSTLAFRDKPFKPKPEARAGSKELTADDIRDRVKRALEKKKPRGVPRKNRSKSKAKRSNRDTVKHASMF